jgi:hypothetical protein
MTPAAPSPAATVAKTGKFFRLNPDTVHRLKHASKLSGIDEQQIAEDALALYFGSTDAGVAAQREALLTRISHSQPPAKRA